jgi:hypothetical protein
VLLVGLPTAAEELLLTLSPPEALYPGQDAAVLFVEQSLKLFHFGLQKDGYHVDDLLRDFLAEYLIQLH